MKLRFFQAAMLFFMTGLLVGQSAEPRVQGRSMVISKTGVVAAEHPLASQAGAAILAQGGTAVDAAIAANAVMGVVSPMMCGIGGDLFAIVYEARTDKVYALNASGWSPAKLNADWLRAQGFTNMPINGIHSVTVPGAVDGWDELRRRFGKKEFSQLLGPAIRYAREGFPVSEWVAQYWSETEAGVRKEKGAAATFLPNDAAPRVGDLFRNKDLAWAYEQIAQGGRKAFYEGAIAKKILNLSQGLGGVLEPGDLREFHSGWVDPISTTYRGWTVYELPPNGQGIAALAMLNLMEQYPIQQMPAHSAEALHLKIEAKKLAYADMLQQVGDPKFGAIPTRGMLSKEYAADRAKLISAATANCQPKPGQPVAAGSDTTYLCVVDQEGNMVSLIQSVYYMFGSMLVPEGAGFVLQNRGGLFTLQAGHPNFLQPRKRPLHTIIPALMRKENLAVAFGIMGGWNQAQAHAQFVSNIADHGMNIQAALEAPRFTKLTFEGCDVQMESRFPEPVLAELEGKGHQIIRQPPFSSTVGGGQAVLRDFSAKVNYGASDPRKDGAAVPAGF